MDLLATTSRLGGAARIGDLRRAGATRYAVEKAIADGSLVRPRPGTVHLPGAPALVVTAVSYHASFACVTALNHHGVDLLVRPVSAHLTGAATTGPSGVMWHRGPADGLAVGVVRALVQMLTCRPAAEGLVALDSLLRTGRVTAEEVSAALPARRPGPARWVLGHGDGASDSVLESLLRYHLLCNGLCDLVLQAPIPGLGRVDLLIGGWLIVEADGFAFHSDPAAFAEDRRRTTVAAEQGYVTLRVGWRELRGDPAGVVRRIRTVWERGRLLARPDRAAVGPQ